MQKLSHLTFINSLKNIKTQTTGIISCLEPVYSIIFASFLLREVPTLREILCGVIILSTVFYSTIKSNNKYQSSESIAEPHFTDGPCSEANK